jgi:hypothetical protein
MKVYYFSRPLNSRVLKWFAYADERARHAGVIIDAPGHGLVKIETTAGENNNMQLAITPIDEFHVQTRSVQGRWGYYVGDTSFDFGTILDEVNLWMDAHPGYQFYNDNCRAFTDHMLRTLFNQDSGVFFFQEGVRINGDRFFNDSPCEEIEHRIKKEGFNVPNHIPSLVGGDAKGSDINEAAMFSVPGTPLNGSNAKRIGMIKISKRINSQDIKSQDKKSNSHSVTIMVSQGALSMMRLFLHGIGRPQSCLIDLSHIASTLLKNEQNFQNAKLNKQFDNTPGGNPVQSSSGLLNSMVERLSCLELSSGLQIANITLNLSDRFLSGRFGPKFRQGIRVSHCALKTLESYVSIDRLYKNGVDLIHLGGVTQNLLGMFNAGLVVWTNNEPDKYLMSDDPAYLFKQSKTARAILFKHDYNMRQSSWSNRLGKLNSIHQILLSFFPAKFIDLSSALPFAKDLIMGNMILQYLSFKMAMDVCLSIISSNQVNHIETLMREGKSDQAYKLIEQNLKRDPNNKIILALKDFYDLQQEVAGAELFVWALSNVIGYLPDKMNTPYLTQMFSVVNQLIRQYNACGLQVLAKNFLNSGQFSLYNLYSLETLSKSFSTMVKNDPAMITRMAGLILSMVDYHSDMTKEHRFYLQTAKFLMEIISSGIEIGFYNLRTPDLGMTIVFLVSSACRLYRDYQKDQLEFQSSLSHSLMMVESAANLVLTNPILNLYSKMYMAGMLFGKIQKPILGISFKKIGQTITSKMAAAGTMINAAMMIKLGIDAINLYRQINYQGELEKVEKMIREGNFDSARKELKKNFNPWEKSANYITYLVFGKDWTEEEVHREYLSNLVELNYRSSTENHMQKLKSFLMLVENSSMSTAKKSDYSTNAKLLINQLKINDSRQTMFLLDCSMRVTRFIILNGIYSLSILNRYIKPFIFDLKNFGQEVNAKLVKFHNENDGYLSLMLGCHLLPFITTMGNYTQKTGVKLFRLYNSKVRHLLPSFEYRKLFFVSHLATLIQELTIVSYLNSQHRLYLEGKMLVETSAINRQQIKKNIQSLSAWYACLINSDWNFKGRIVNAILLLLDDVIDFNDKSKIKRKQFDIILLLSELALLVIQNGHQHEHDSTMENKSIFDDFFSSTTFYTVSQALSIGSRVTRVLQNYYSESDLKNFKSIRFLNNLVNRFNTDPLSRAYSYYLTILAFLNLYPDWQSLLPGWQWLLTVSWILSPILSGLLEFKTFVTDNTPDYVSFVIQSLLLGYVVYALCLQKDSVYRSYKLQTARMDSEQLITEQKFNEAHEILKTIEDDSLHIKLMKALAALYKDEAESDRARELIPDLFKMAEVQSSERVGYLNYIISLSLGLVRLCRDMSFQDGKSYLLKACNASDELLALEPDSEMKKLEKLNIIEHFVSLSLEQDIKENDREDLLQEAILKAKPFVNNDLSRKVLYKANLIVGNANFILQQYSDDSVNLQEISKAEEYLKRALDIIKKEASVSKNPNEDIVQLLSQLAQLSCKQGKWSVALRCYEEMKAQPNLTTGLRNEINRRIQEISRLIQYVGSSRSNASVLSSMGMFTRASNADMQQEVTDEKYNEEDSLLIAPAAV